MNSNHSNTPLARRSLAKEAQLHRPNSPRSRLRAFVTPRAATAFALCSSGVLLAVLSFAAPPPRAIEDSIASSPGDSRFADKQAGALNSKAKASLGIPLAPAAEDAWSIVSSPNTSITKDNELTGVTCVSASNCWAVGYYGNPYSQTSPAQSLIEHWDGTSWTIVISPNTSATLVNVLYGVTCVSASECWAVGNYNISSNVQQTLIERWDGTSWAIVTSPNASTTQSNYLTGVTCVSASECWAVGYYANGNVFQTLIERWDGTSWAIVISPNASTTQSNYLFGVTCVSASECWAIGYYVLGNAAFQTLIERWDGTSWAIVTSPNNTPSATDCILSGQLPGCTQGNLLYDVKCVSASECWTVGYYIHNTDNIQQTLIERWDGTSWAIVSSPNTSTTEHNLLYGMTCVSASNCWVVGYHVAGSVWQTLIERWDGTSWAIFTSPNTDATQNDFLQAVKCVSASDCWAVGFYTNSIGQPQTLTEHYGVLPVPLNAVVSQKVHGSDGPFDIDLPLDGSGIECRSGGANGDYKMVFTFVNNTSVTSASVTSGTGTVSSSALGPNPNQYTVNLTGVTNAQYLRVTLYGLLDSAGNRNSTLVGPKMGVLVGDTTGDGFVNSTDIAQTKSQSGISLTTSNFREDLTADGSLNSTDIAFVKSKSGTALP